MAVLMNQVTAKTKASRIMGPVLREGGGSASVANGLVEGAEAGASALISSRRLSGSPITRWAPAQMKQAMRHPSSASMRAEIGQQMVLASPASRVIPVIALRALVP